MEILVPLIFLGVGVICGVVLFFIWRNGRNFRARAHRVPGVVVEVDEEYSSNPDGTGGSKYYPIFRFRAYDGRDIQVKSSWGTSPSRTRPGDPVAVLYDPAKPEEAKIDRFFQRGGLNLLIMGLFTVMFTGIGVIAAVALNG